LATIPGLLLELQTVPPAPAYRGDPRADELRADWRAWRDKVIAFRKKRHALCATDERQRQAELMMCARSRAYFLTIWGSLHEPRRRKSQDGSPPFIPFAKQIDLLDALDAALQAEEGADQDVVGSKCRDVGATWTLANAAVHDFLFVPDSIIGCISYKQEYADSPDMKSIGAKVRYTLYHLPEWMRPNKQKGELKDKTNLLKNFLNGNEIFMDSTTSDSMVGARGSWALFDELAKHEHGKDAWSGTASAFDTRIGISTEDFQHGSFFYDLHTGRNDEGHKPRVVTIDWWENPMLDEKWYAAQKRRFANDPHRFALEIERNPFTNTESFVYPEARFLSVNSAVAFDPTLPQYTTIDPGVRDDCALVFLQENPHTGDIDVLDVYVNNGKPADYYGKLLSGDLTGFDFDDNAHRLQPMLKARYATKGTYIGDVAGWNQEAATMDSFYSRLEPYQIFVRRDRMHDGEIAQSQRMAKSFRGRREAMREIFPRLRFANTSGAALVLEAFRQNRYRDTDRAVQSEERKPLHDWTSHPVSAMEYFAVNKRLERQILDTYLKRPPKPSRMNQRRMPDSAARYQRLQGVTTW
jgi:hypothetical protein